MVLQTAEIDKRLSYRLSTSGPVAILALEGEVDAYTIAKARRLVDTVLAEGYRFLVVDASGIRYLDSAGAGFFVSTWHRLKVADGGIRLAALSSSARRMVRVLQLELVIEVHDAVAAAVESLGTHIQKQIDRWKELLGSAEYPDVRAKLGEAFLARGLPMEAEFHFRRALEVNERFLAALLGISRVMIGHGRKEEAARYLSRALEIAPAHPRATALLGLVTGDRELLGQALKLLRKELRANPRFADIHNCRGEVLFGLERLGDSRDAFREALRINDGYVQARLNLARVQLRLRHKALARTELAKIPGDAAGWPLAKQIEELHRELHGPPPPG